MKTCIKNPFILPALVAALGFILIDRVATQTFTTLHSFTAASGSLATNSEGYHPPCGLILSGKTLYRTAAGGGSSGNGTVDNYQIALSGNSVAAGFVADSKGNLYVVGSGSPTYYGANNWIVRWNQGGINSWSTVDNS